MLKIWPRDTIRELIALATTSGESKAILGDVEEAKLFRFAIYNFRRHEDIGADIAITLDGAAVVLRQKVQPKVSIVPSFGLTQNY